MTVGVRVGTVLHLIFQLLTHLMLLVGQVQSTSPFNLNKGKPGKWQTDSH